MKNKDFGNRYDNVYRDGLQNSIWPWTGAVVTLNKLKRYLNPDAKILEIGCGMGANIQLIQSMGYKFYGIDFSKFAINEILEAHPELSGSLQTGDFTKSIKFPDIKFDLILDRAGLTCNPTSKIKNCIKLIQDNLIPGGFFVGIDWYSTDHSEFKNGKAQEDEFSLNFIGSESMFDPPRMHFSSKEHIIDLFREFEIINLEHNLKEVSISFHSKPINIASWDFVARFN